MGVSWRFHVYVLCLFERPRNVLNKRTRYALLLYSIGIDYSKNRLWRATYWNLCTLRKTMMTYERANPLSIMVTTLAKTVPQLGAVARVNS